MDSERRDLESLYTHVDAHALNYRSLMEIGDQFQNLRDLLYEKGDEDSARVAQYEVDALNLQSSGTALGAMMIAQDANGHEVQIPDISKFTDDEFKYFCRRLRDVTNARLKARYAHILWNSPQKHRQYAEVAVRAYLQLIPCYEAKDREERSGERATVHRYGQDVIEFVKCAVGIAMNAHVLIDEAVSEVARLVEEFNPTSSSWYSLNYELLELMIDNWTVLTDDTRNPIPIICQRRADQLRASGHLDGAIELNKLGLRSDQLLSANTASWNARIAECYEQMMDNREGSPMVAAEWCQQAMDYYGAIGDRAKVDELALKREKFGNEMEFQKISSRIDQTAHIAWCERAGEELATHTTDEIIGAIVTDPNLLPSKRDMDHQAKESAKSSPLIALISETVMDDRMHVVEHVSTPDEKLKRGRLEAFKFHLKLDKVPLINAVIHHARRSNKINLDKIIESLTKNSWIGATLSCHRGSDSEYTYCWIDQLRPAMDEYFSYMDKMLDGKEPEVPPIAAIDSLVIKFEGLVRDFAQLKEIPTHIDAKDKAGRSVTREKDLSQLLYDTRIAELFTEDDLLYFRFLFIEHSGFTLRHRVAHGLMRMEDYSFGILQLVFVAVMRLSKYGVGGGE